MVLAIDETNPIQTLLSLNKSFISKTTSAHPTLLPSLASGQAPPVLWLGCSDSRVPETTLLSCQPGDIFTHRNIANVLTPSDLSAQSVIAYAVQFLKVKVVVVAGHVGCGGVAAALDDKALGLLDTWLAPLRALRAKHLAELSSLPEKERALKLVELNVQAGVGVVRANPVVVAAERERGLQVLGVVYDVGTGQLRPVECEESTEEKRARVEVFGLGSAGGHGEEEEKKKAPVATAVVPMREKEEDSASKAAGEAANAIPLGV